MRTVKMAYEAAVMENLYFGISIDLKEVTRQLQDEEGALE